jgi:hypothetical protein
VNSTRNQKQIDQTSSGDVWFSASSSFQAGDLRVWIANTSHIRHCVMVRPAFAFRVGAASAAASSTSNTCRSLPLCPTSACLDQQTLCPRPSCICKPSIILDGLKSIPPIWLHGIARAHRGYTPLKL